MNHPNAANALAGLHQFEWKSIYCAAPLECHCDYTPAEVGSRESGLQIEPDHAASMTLHAAFVKGADISELLSVDTVSAIEAAALADYCKAEAV